MSKFFTALIAALFSLTGIASANLITIDGGLGTITCNGADANVCEAITGGSLVVGNPGNEVKSGTEGLFSASTADAYNIGNASEENEAVAFNTLAGLSLLGTDGNQTNPGSIFTTVAKFFTIKIGDMTLFLKNTCGCAIDVVFTPTAGTGSGLSHITEFGEVPIPGAIWLMGAGLAGLGFAGRKKKAR